MSVPARERIARLSRSFDERDPRMRGGDPLGFEGYRDSLRDARERSGLTEACVWGTADIDGSRCALVVLDFAFLGGSMGAVVGEKVARCFDSARRSKLPVVCVTASGGARMQEGMVALVQMAKTSEARRRHAASGLGQVTLLTSPTTGGVYASFASLADVIFAEPGATVGFAGPRVVEQLTGQRPDAGVHTAEFAFEHGLVDALLPSDEQAGTVGRALRNLAGSPSVVVDLSHTDPPTGPRRSAWERLQLARRADRPKAPAILDMLLDDAIELRGDRGGTDDRAVVVRVGALRPAGRRVVAVGLDASGHGRVGPAGYRKARRGIDLAGRLGLPLVTLVDTRGADPLPGSEGQGVAANIARTFVTMLGCPAPTVAAITGEGGSGGALALAVADRVLAWENAIFSVIAPEGAAAILYRDGSRADELAERLGITAGDLVRLGIVDTVVAEPPTGAHADPAAAVAGLGRAIADAVDDLVGLPRAGRLAVRRRRWRHAGRPSR